ncbi:UNVERIFIED_CONTAM: hypothetical protein K2H54_010756 [Gekko kuhli]
MRVGAYLLGLKPEGSSGHQRWPWVIGSGGQWRPAVVDGDGHQQWSRMMMLVFGSGSSGPQRPRVVSSSDQLHQLFRQSRQRSPEAVEAQVLTGSALLKDRLGEVTVAGDVAATSGQQVEKQHSDDKSESHGTEVEL